MFGSRISQFYTILTSSIDVVFKFCDRMPGFNELSKPDRDLLFRSSCLELFTLRLAHRYWVYCTHLHSVLYSLHRYIVYCTLYSVHRYRVCWTQVHSVLYTGTYCTVHRYIVYFTTISIYMDQYWSYICVQGWDVGLCSTNDVILPVSVIKSLDSFWTGLHSGSLHWYRKLGVVNNKTIIF